MSRGFARPAEQLPAWPCLRMPVPRTAPHKTRMPLVQTLLATGTVERGFYLRGEPIREDIELRSTVVQLVQLVSDE